MTDLTEIVARAIRDVDNRAHQTASETEYAVAVIKAICARVETLEAALREANNTAMHHLASIAELEGRVKMYAVDLADLRRQLAEAEREITRLIGAQRR